MIREAAFSDAVAIANIYNYYILNTVITFEIDPINPQEIIKRMEKYKEAGPYLVAEEDGEVIGYAYVSKFRERPAYEHSVETSIYLKNGCDGKGLGTKLYSELLTQVALKSHTIIGGIALPNEASVKLHEKCGFKKVAHFSEVGLKFGKWIDVGFWQREGMYTGRQINK
ncbi:MAG TPA: GNAT family N-acetyltransferase [Anaerolineales bacterium]|nr:GNAT family N-acetyltransferase [Anaerolineales bacterium]